MLFVSNTYIQYYPSFVLFFICLEKSTSAQINSETASHIWITIAQINDKTAEVTFGLLSHKDDVSICTTACVDKGALFSY